MSKRAYLGPIDPVTRAPPKLCLGAGSVVRYVGAQDPKMAGIEGVIMGAHGASYSVSHSQWVVKWVNPIKGQRGLPGARWETTEPAWNLKVLRGFTKPFRDGLAWANSHVE